MRQFVIIALVTVTFLGLVIVVTPPFVSAHRSGSDQQELTRQLRRYDLLQLDAAGVIEQVRQSGQLTLPTSDGTFELSLLPHDMRADNYRSDEVSDGGKVRGLDRKPVVTYRGTVRGMSGAQARFTIDNNLVEGLIITRAGKYFVEPASRFSSTAARDEYVVYRESDVIEQIDVDCPVTLSEEVRAGVARNGSLFVNSKQIVTPDALSPAREAEIATEADNEFVQAVGGTQAANNEILSILNMVDGVYQTEIGLTFRVVYQRAWDPATPDPYSDTTDAVALLTEVRTFWNSNPPANAPARDVVHMWTGKSTNSAGIAFGARPGVPNDGVVCRDALYPGGSASYGLSRRFTHTVTRVVVPAHEIGHNLGAMHPDQETPSHPECSSTIMNSDGTFSTLTFCQFSRDQIINNIIANGSCLDVATTPPPTIQFGTTTYSATEGADRSIEMTVNRSNGSGVSTVSYETVDQASSERSDYTTARGSLSFNAGETTKTFTVFITDDVFGETTENFQVLLSNPTAATLGTPSAVSVAIVDNDGINGLNPVRDASFSPDFFVRQHYVDFLNREADAPGLGFWVGQFTECDSRPVAERALCRELRKINISAAFFLSMEFQETGFYVIRLQRVAFGHRSDAAASRVAYQQFIRDSRQVGAGVVVGQPGFEQLLDQNKQAYAQQIVGGSDFETRFPSSQSASQYVDALFASAGVAPTPTEQQNAITAFNNGGRVGALRNVVESNSVRQAELNTSFVLMQYYGYLRRNPTDLPDTNDGGYQFWLGKLNQFGGNFVNAEMVKAFITSSEYQQRFGP